MAKGTLALRQIKLGDNADTSKNFVISVPAVADGTLTIERENGTDVLTIDAGGNIRAGSACNLVGNGPAFSARRTSSQTGIASATPTKVQLPVEDFDTASAFDSVANFRFTPKVAGYYQFDAGIYCTGATITEVQVIIRKNSIDALINFNGCPSRSDQKITVSGLLYMNGSTDYVELWGQGTAGTLSFGTSTYLTGFLARAA